MKLAVVCYPTYGGSGVVASELAISLAERGHEVHVVSHDNPFRIGCQWRHNLIVHTVEEGSYPLFRYPLYALNLANKLIQVVEEHGVQVIHSHYAIPHAAAAWNAREVLRHERGIDVELACTLHGTDITLVGKERGYHDLTRFAIAQQDLLTAPSAWLADETTTHFRIPRSRIHIVPNFIDLDRFSPATDSSLRQELAPNGEAVLCHASNFRPVKRVLDVVRAFAVVRQHLPAVLVLAGDGPDLANAEQLARELGVREHLRVLGKVPDIERVLQASDVFFLPSVSESFGLAALEALACGCPVIGYRTGGLPEVVEHEVSGMLCCTGEEVCLGGLTKDLLTDPERYQAMRAAARKRAELFAAKPIIDTYEHLLLRLLDD